MKFWDASAIVPLLVDEPWSSQLKAVAVRDSGICVWWASEIECISALTRLERSGILAARDLATALARLMQMSTTWQEVFPSAAVRDLAARLLRVHPLRAADALQLAAAQVAANPNPHALEFVTLDERLALAAHKEGFAVIDAETLA